MLLINYDDKNKANKATVKNVGEKYFKTLKTFKDMEK